MGLSSVEKLYSYVQKVYFKFRKGEEKCKMLRISLEIRSELTISPGKVLSLQITDDFDSIFFYSLMLTQEDFSVLKSQQGLLVDFDHFPSQLIKLLEICKSQDVGNKFILVLDDEDSVFVQSSIEYDNGCIYLKVIETNNFKNLCHLSLKVAEETNYLKLETSHQISEEREKITKLQSEWQQKLELEKSQLINQHQKQINDLNEQINSLTFNNKNLYESRCQLETSVKEKSFQIEALEKQNMHLNQEITLLKRQTSQLDQDYHEKDKMVISLKTKLAVAEQELKDKSKYLEKQQELLKSANEQKAFLEEALNEKEVQLQRKQSAVQTLSADLMKYNDLIAKLQSDLAANKAKMKLRTDIALEQEKVLEKKVQQLTSQANTIKELNEKILKLTEELSAIKNELQEANKKIEEKEMTIKKNDNVINWLNRRLTECNTGSSQSPTLITSTRTENDSILAISQPKGNISNLAKGWPPWLINSIAGCNSSNGDSTGASSNCTNSFIPSSINATQGNVKSDTLKEPLQSKCEELKKKEEKNIDFNGVTDLKKQSKGLDPKYFQSSIDKDFIFNPQIIKKNITAVDSIKSKEQAKSANGRKQISAYFPKTAPTLQ
ncbi:Spindle assembly abnormal protein, putative [Pediculus humanus corporis]|uniref:Spindle assembly abnormal protein, putative n=1 Tax=Pediculus humanus subsp. corporis TaxID=121224 RepID=E0VU88_PEDHC|nr:Spindle assembly abnormal protein, putative [Pediculus humanus corporis]EEB16944.1 Spindle assembly abnormal protein, putative [Pediculus humanus corporis]